VNGSMELRPQVSVAAREAIEIVVEGSNAIQAPR
jgi:hypothetical protein